MHRQNDESNSGTHEPPRNHSRTFLPCHTIRRMIDRIHGYDIFISHAWEPERDYADKLRQLLHEANPPLVTFVDRRDLAPDDEVNELILNYLRRSSFLVVLVSEGSLDDGHLRPYVKSEVDAFLRLSRPILSIKLSNDVALPPELANRDLINEVASHGGLPSQSVVESLANKFRLTRRRVAMSRFYMIAITVFILTCCGLLAAILISMRWQYTYALNSHIRRLEAMSANRHAVSPTSVSFATFRQPQFELDLLTVSPEDAADARKHIAGIRTVSSLLITSALLGDSALFSHLTGLKDLHVKYEGDEGAEPELLLHRCSELQDLKVYRMVINSATLQSLPSACSLRKCELVQCEVDCKIGDLLDKCSELVSLKLEATYARVNGENATVAPSMSGRDFEKLGEASIETLDLRGAQFSKSDLKYLEHSKSLRELWLPKLEFEQGELATLLQNIGVVMIWLHPSDIASIDQTEATRRDWIVDDYPVSDSDWAEKPEKLDRIKNPEGPERIEKLEELEGLESLLDSAGSDD